MVFDSGIGGVTVLRRLIEHLPRADFTYVADDAGFPYGPQPAEALRQRIVDLFDDLIATYRPDAVVIACNTASTLVLADLRARHRVPFVGTVPAIKPAAARTRSGLISVLATPGTVARDYTRDLIDRFAPDVDVTLVGSKNLARIAEARLRGEPVDSGAVAAELAPCFVDRDGVRTDTIVLACTHFPLLVDRFIGVAPWPVDWLDPADAIARRAAAVLGEPDDDLRAAGGPVLGRIVFTSGTAPFASLSDLLRRAEFSA